MIQCTHNKPAIAVQETVDLLKFHHEFAFDEIHDDEDKHVTNFIDGAHLALSDYAEHMSLDMDDDDTINP